MLFLFFVQLFTRARLSIFLTAIFPFAAGIASAQSSAQCANAVRVESLADARSEATDRLITELVRLEGELRARHAYERLPELELLTDRVLSAGARELAKLRGEIDVFGTRLTEVPAASVHADAIVGTVRMTKQARKEFEDLQPHLAVKAREIIAMFEAGGRSVTEAWRGNGSWQFEKLNPLEGYNDDLYSLRLNKGYRAVFLLGTGDEITFIHFSKTATHGT